MRYRPLPLVLAGALTLSLLTACGGPAESPVPTESEAVTPPVVETTAPVQSTEAVSPAVTDGGVVLLPPAQSAEVAPLPPEQSAQVEPLATPAPTPQPIETPGPSAAPVESLLTAAGVYETVSAAAGGDAMSDVSFALEDYYSLSAADLDDYVLYMPDMSATIQEIFIAKVGSGRMDAVKAACESRQKGMAEDAQFYPATGTYVDSYQLVTSGDWVLFCVCETPDAAVEAFNNCTK